MSILKRDWRNVTVLLGVMFFVLIIGIFLDSIKEEEEVISEYESIIVGTFIYKYNPDQALLMLVVDHQFPMPREIIADSVFIVLMKSHPDSTVYISHASQYELSFKPIDCGGEPCG